VGRAAELSGLDNALRDAERGHGSVVVLVGERGLGKSRLV
jgi:predicted ATPase